MAPSFTPAFLRRKPSFSTSGFDGVQNRFSVQIRYPFTSSNSLLVQKTPLFGRSSGHQSGGHPSRMWSRYVNAAKRTKGRPRGLAKFNVHCLGCRIRYPGPPCPCCTGFAESNLMNSHQWLNFGPEVFVVKELFLGKARIGSLARLCGTFNRVSAESIRIHPLARSECQRCSGYLCRDQFSTVEEA